MLSRCASICYYRSTNSLQLFGLAKCLKKLPLVKFYTVKIFLDDKLPEIVLSGEKDLGTLEQLFQERVNSADLGNDVENLVYCLELVDIWLQNSLLDKADWAIQLIEDSAFKYGLPYNVQLLQLLARLRFKQSRFQDSADALHRLKAIGLEHPCTLSNLGIVYSAMENYDRAAFYFDQVDLKRISGKYNGTCKCQTNLVTNSETGDLTPLYSPDRYHFQTTQSVTQEDKKVSSSSCGKVLKQVRDRNNTEMRYRKAYDLLGASVDS